MLFFHTRLSIFRFTVLVAALLAVSVASVFFFRKDTEKTAIYGALAVGQNKGAWGVSDPSPDREAANKGALDYCMKYSDDCIVVLNLKNNCVAVATGNRPVITWAEEDTPEEARSKAQSTCILKTKDSCEIKHSYCYH